MTYLHDVRALLYGPQENLVSAIAAHQLQHGNELLDRFKEQLRRSELVTAQNLFSLQVQPTVGCLHFQIDQCNTIGKFALLGHPIQKFMIQAAERYRLQYEWIRVGQDPGDVEELRSPQAKGYLFLGCPRIFSNADEDPATLKLPLFAL